MAMLQLVTFQLGKAHYGLDIHFIKEVNPQPAMTAVPLSSDEICGLVNIRGQVALVVDMAVVMGFPPVKQSVTHQVIILKVASELRAIREIDIERPELFGDKPMGFLVNNVGDVLTLDSSELEPPPPHLNKEQINLYRGVARLERQVLQGTRLEQIVLQVLNPEAIVQWCHRASNTLAETAKKKAMTL